MNQPRTHGLWCCRRELQRSWPHPIFTPQKSGISSCIFGLYLCVTVTTNDQSGYRLGSVYGPTGYRIGSVIFMTVTRRYNPFSYPASGQISRSKQNYKEQGSIIFETNGANLLSFSFYALVFCDFIGQALSMAT